MGLRSSWVALSIGNRVASAYGALNFLVGPLKRRSGTGGVNFNVFLTLQTQNIISTYTKINNHSYKQPLISTFLFFYTEFETLSECEFVFNFISVFRRKHQSINVVYPMMGIELTASSLQLQCFIHDNISRIVCLILAVHLSLE